MHKCTYVNAFDMMIVEALVGSSELKSNSL